MEDVIKLRWYKGKRQCICHYCHKKGDSEHKEMDYQHVDFFRLSINNEKEVSICASCYESLPLRKILMYA